MALRMQFKIVLHVNFDLFLSLKPLVRFRRAVRTVQVLLRATLTNRQTHRNEAKLLSWAHDDYATSKRTYEMFGLSFDPTDYRAKREVYRNSNY